MALRPAADLAPEPERRSPGCSHLWCCLVGRRPKSLCCPWSRETWRATCASVLPVLCAASRSFFGRNDGGSRSHHGQGPKILGGVNKLCGSCVSADGGVGPSSSRWGITGLKRIVATREKTRRVSKTRLLKWPRDKNPDCLTHRDDHSALIEPTQRRAARRRPQLIISQISNREGT